MMKYNFNAGPSYLPDEVLMKASQAVIEYEGSGLSILTMSHRGPEFESIMQNARNLVKKLLGLNDDFEVMFLHGGATQQFIQVPMNFLEASGNAAYTDTGIWASKAIKEAQKFGHVEVIASSADKNYSYLPKSFFIPHTATYVHYTSNNTVYGTQWKEYPDTEVPIVVDMSSDIFSYQYDFSKFSMIYAGAQKNAGTAGATIVIIRKDLLTKKKNNLPGLFDYANNIKADSILNTAPVFPVYVSYLTLQWLEGKGGLAAIEAENNEKAALLYNTIDSLPTFEGTVAKEDRSNMNACFTLVPATLEKEFLALAEKENFYGIAGHRSVGGYRVSMYNAIPLEHIKAFTDFMTHFANKKG